MKKIILLFSCLLLLTSLNNAKEKIPGKVEKSIPKLTDYLCENRGSNRSKVEAIYTWITENIKYDYDQLSSTDYFTGVDPSKILKAKSAICNGYVELMKAMLDHIGIKSETVEGYVRNEYWLKGKLVLMDTHAWVALRFDGEWHLLDPTWDAGYIGRMPKNIKPYEEKKYIRNNFKNKVKAEKVKKKREEKEKERMEKYNEQPENKDKIGFVPYPQKTYFLIHPDSFLVTHLPVNPIWQLREDYISIEDFSEGEDAIRDRLSINSGKKLDFNTEIDEYINKDFLHQLLVNGEDGFEFNQYNPSIKALNYFNFMSLIHHKGLQKLARGSIYEITPSKYPALNAITDSIIKYTKLYKKAEKGIYKDNKTFDKNQSKETIALSKINQKLIRKIDQENEKMVSLLKKENERIKSNLERFKQTKDKMDEKTPWIFTYSKPKLFKDDIVAVWKDSIQQQIDTLKSIQAQYIKLRNDTKFNTMLEDVHFVRFLILMNNESIKNNNYLSNQYILDLDTMIATKSNHALFLFADSLKMEIMGKEVMNIYRKATTYIRLAKTDFKKLVTENKIADTEQYDEFMQAELLKVIDVVEEINISGAEFNSIVLSVLKRNKLIGDIQNLIEDQLELKEEKYEYISEYTETNHERGLNLIEKLTEDSKAWKELYEPQN